MKTLYKLLIVGVAVIFGLTGCLAGVFSPFLGGTSGDGDQTTQTALIDTTNTTESAADPTGSPFNFTNTAGTGALTNAADQLIIVNFANGMVDAVDGAIEGLTVYELLATAATNGEYAHGATVSYTADVIDNGNGSSTARLSLSLDTTTMSDWIEIEMDPTLLTANGGTRLFNEDGDDVPAEAGEDAAYAYLAVGGTPPVTASGVPRDPRDYVGIVTLDPAVDTSTDITVTITPPAAGTVADFSATSLSGGFSLWTFAPATGAWTQVSITPTYDGAGTLTLLPAASVTAGGIYQIRVDLYSIMTSVPVAGFVQRGTLAQNNSSTRYVRSTQLLVETAGTYATVNTVASNDGGSATPVYVYVQFIGGGDVVTSSVTNDSVRFVMNDNGNIYQLPYDNVVVWSGVDDANVLRFYFSPTFDPDVLPGSQSWTMYLYPTVTTTAGDPVLNINDPIAGVTTDSGQF